MFIVTGIMNSVAAMYFNEKVIDGIYDKDQYFLNFIIKSIEEKREEWIREYTEDFDGYIGKYVNMYTQNNLI